MALPWELRRRGLKDSLRHDQRVKDAIRKNLRELIAEEAIITSDGQKTVKIPVRYLDQYRFKYGQPQPGVGQGPGQPGDRLGHQAGPDEHGNIQLLYQFADAGTAHLHAHRVSPGSDQRSV